MELHLAIAVVLAVGIGLVLGLLGSGGSILTLPVLVYVAGVPVASAVGMSLAIVGGTSVAGAWWKHRQGLVHWRAAALFSGAGMSGSLVGAQFTRLVSPGVLMLIFAGLMTAVALRMLARRGDEALEPLPDCRPVRCLLAGLGVGLVTGFIGVGGGILLVPAMILLARLPMASAVGTSLVVIAANSFAGWLGHVARGPFAWSLSGAFLLAAFVGMAAGAGLGGRLKPATLRLVFGWFVLGVAGFVLAKNWQAFGFTSGSN
ncbi:MAG TPA: permease [Verrucomicrobiales bacterium]|nr:permease [Verrucomicrobiales bacterium]